MLKTTYVLSSLELLIVMWLLFRQIRDGVEDMNSGRYFMSPMQKGFCRIAATMTYPLLSQSNLHILNPNTLWSYFHADISVTACHIQIKLYTLT